MKRRLPSYIIGGIGVTLILIAFSTRLFSAAPAFERLTDDFRPVMQEAQLAQLEEDVDGLNAVAAEFTTKVVPGLAAALDMSTTEFSALIGQQFPAVAAGLQAVPQVTEELTGVLTVLGDEQARFAQSDEIPTASLPVTTVPWALVGIGVLCIAVAFFMPRRKGAAAAVALGIGLVVVPLALSLPGKADATDTMNSNLKPVYTSELVDSSKRSLAGMQAMGSDLETKLLPAMAQMLQLSEAQVQAFLASNFPAVTAGITSMPATLGRFQDLTNVFDGSLGNYDTAKGTTLVPIVWALLIAGILLAGVGGYVFRSSEVGARRTAGHPRVAIRQRLGHAAHGRLSH